MTRGNIIQICKEENIGIIEKDFNLEATYNADEAFATGTFAGVIPIVKIDGRIIGNGKKGVLTERLFKLYKNKINQLYPNEK